MGENRSLSHPLDLYVSLLTLSLSLFIPKEDRRLAAGRFVLRSARFDREDSQIREAALASARASPERERERERR